MASEILPTQITPILTFEMEGKQLSVNHRNVLSPAEVNVRLCPYVKNTRVENT